jgi:hypothetical protein
MSLSPIILFVYSRPVHTLRTLEALAANELADQSHLFIFCDAAKPQASPETLQNIAEVRQLVRSRQWCKTVTIAEGTVNRGIAVSTVTEVTKIVNEYGKVIILEDDVVTQKGFLTFLNQALDMYENDHNIFGITGYAFPVPAHLPDTFFLPIVSSWGWATWKRAWQHYKGDALFFENYLKANQLEKKFNFGYHGNYEILQKKITHHTDVWDVCWYASMFMENGLYLFPRCSLLSNIGFDSTGTNCDEDPFYATHETTDFVNLTRIAPKLIPEIVQAVDKNFQKHFAPKPLYVRIFNRLKRIFLQVT